MSNMTRIFSVIDLDFTNNLLSYFLIFKPSMTNHASVHNPPPPSAVRSWLPKCFKTTIADSTEVVVMSEVFCEYQSLSHVLQLLCWNQTSGLKDPSCNPGERNSYVQIERT